jgi:RND superfamily putative drug exporter
LLTSLGRYTYRLRWAVITAWLILFAASAAVAPRVTGILRGGGYTIGNSQSVRAYDVLHHAYGYRALTFTAVFTGDPTHIMAAAERFRSDAVRRYGTTLTVARPVYTPDRHAVFERIFSQPQEDFGAHFASGLRSLMPHSAVRGYLTGSSAIFHDMEQVSDQDLRRIELITLPIAAVVLLFIFGALLASAVPVLMAPISVSITLALVYFLGHRMDMSIFVLNTASMLGLAVAIDYSLLMVNRFREEISLGRPMETAVANSVATAGKAILVSGLVVSAGFLGLTLAGVSMLQSLGVGGCLVTIISLLLALSFLPAVLGVLGARINRGAVLPERLASHRVWRAIAERVMRWPVRIILVVAAIIVVTAIPAFHLRVGIPGPQILPPSVDSRAGNDVLDRHLGYANRPPVLVVVIRDPGTRPSTAQATAFTVLDRICSSRQVVGVSSAAIADSPRQIRTCQATLSAIQSPTAAESRQAQAAARTHRVGLISVFLRSDPSSAAAEDFVRGLRSGLAIPGYRILVGGQTAGQMDFNTYLYSRFPRVALAVIAVIFLVLLVAFRSLLLPLKAVLMNVFSVMAAYGAVTWAFQDGHLARPLGFTPVGNIDSIVPVFLFCVLFGVSTDYEVFLLSRVQEEYRRGADNETSVARGLEVTGRIITSAALVMIVVFIGFAFARLVVVQEVGLALAVAVLVDATLIRALLVPATMRLLGPWNWWLPFHGFQRPVEPSYGHGHSPAAR